MSDGLLVGRSDKYFSDLGLRELHFRNHTQISLYLVIFSAASRIF